ncbi:MAG: hypothetical protein LLG44_01750, partial [Chloroflexi bacterium]|nr:hypothetical protein [Chloroflexota bacterium]
MDNKPKDSQSPEQSPGIDKIPVLDWFTRVRHSRKGHVVFTILAIIVVCISVYYVSANLLVGLQQVKQANLTLRIWPLVYSLIITWLCVIFGGVTWYLVLYSLGAQVSLRGCIQAHVLANVAGYIPGYGWRYMGKVYLTSRQDESP